MSKQDTIRQHLFTLTKCRTLKSALTGWTVHHLIALPAKRQLQACELCATRFAHGAVITRPTKGSHRPITIAVGGVCLKTVLLKSFREPRWLHTSRSDTKRRLADRYEGLVDPGTWITWVCENAPSDLVEEAVRLKHLGATLSPSGLRKLMAFHDRARRYPSEVLLPDRKDLQRLGTPIPAMLTIDRARAILEGGYPSLMQRLIADRRMAHLDTVTDRLFCYGGVQEEWERLPMDTIRLLVALARLSEADEMRGRFKGLALARRLPKLASDSHDRVFLWHPLEGFGFAPKHWSAIRRWHPPEDSHRPQSAWFAPDSQCLHEGELDYIERRAFLRVDVPWLEPCWKGAHPPERGRTARNVGLPSALMSKEPAAGHSGSAG